MFALHSPRPNAREFLGTTAQDTPIYGQSASCPISHTSTVHAHGTVYLSHTPIFRVPLVVVLRLERVHCTVHEGMPVWGKNEHKTAWRHAI